jgi:4-hydroxy-2-oxoheptanedioate aldolase
MCFAANQEKTLALPENTNLAFKMKRGEPVFGSTMYLGSTTAVEIAANWRLDFAFIDAEHTPVNVDSHMEKLVLAALLAGIAPLVRVRGTNEWDIRKSLEFGATGVIVPQVNNADQARAIVRAAKFPPVGRRGGDASVRAAGFAGPGFQWSKYMEHENATRLVIPMAESFEFFDNIEEILEVEGIDVINFGPADYSISRQISIDYSMSHPEVDEKLAELIEKCHARRIRVMAPCIPPVAEKVIALKKKGVDMIIMGNDVMFLNAGCRGAREAIDAASKAATGVSRYE